MQSVSLITKLKQYARHLKSEIFVLYHAARDPRTPWYVKLLVVIVVAYAFSPIDLIPDFIPVLGYLDDLILLPIGIALAIKLIPELVLIDCRAHAHAHASFLKEKPVNWAAGTVIVILWLIAIIYCGLWVNEIYLAQS